jgi:arginine/lysine/histidine transporter system substrate-binding protein
MKYGILGFLLVLVCGIGIYITMRTPSAQTDDVLVIGTAAGYAPFVSINAHGDYEGFDIDIAHELAQQLQKKVCIKDLGSMPALFMALEQGSIDVIIWGLSITSERLEKVAMVHYQGAVTSSYPLLFWKQIPDGIRTINDLRHKTICVEPSSSQEGVLRQYPFIAPLYVEKVDDALLHIQYKKADAALVEPAIAQKFQKKFPEIEVLELPLAPQDHVQGVGIAVKKDNLNLLHDIEQAIQRMKVNGTITTLEKKWDMV